MISNTFSKAFFGEHIDTKILVFAGLAVITSRFHQPLRLGTTVCKTGVACLNDVKSSVVCTRESLLSEW